MDIRTLKEPDGTAFGQKLFDTASRDVIATVDYEYPTPGSTVPVRNNPS